MTSHMISSLEFIRLESSASARSKATARVPIAPGTIVLADKALSTALFPEEKGRRCDHCHRIPTNGERLLKCSSCAAYWYCGTTCQTRQWEMHHRKICKRFNRFATTPEYQALDSGGKTDAMLLSQLLVRVFPSEDFTTPSAGESDSVAVFFDLLKSPRSGTPTPPLCRPGSPFLSKAAADAYARFDNNNFVIHSHLTSYAHGIFPVASRLLNHSCYPNCAMKYIISVDNIVTMEVVSIRHIQPGEELTVPYLDPALPLDTRRTALHANYGFTCTCPLCTFQESMDSPPSPPTADDAARLSDLEEKLCEHVASRILQLDAHAAFTSQANEVVPWDDLPVALHVLFDERYLPQLSESFSKAAHEGQFTFAMERGRVLLAYYAVTYSPNYPQIGMHALELAKTSWNSVIADDDATIASHSPTAATKRAEDSARHYLALARRVLESFGPEGDDGGPLEEIRVMRELLNC